MVLRCGTHHRFVHDQGWTIATDGRGRFTFAPADEPPIPVAVPLPGATIPEAVLPEWPEELPHHVDPALVFPRNPLAPVAGQARPDYNECLAVIQYELQRLRAPEPDEIVIADGRAAAVGRGRLREGRSVGATSRDREGPPGT